MAGGIVADHSRQLGKRAEIVDGDDLAIAVDQLLLVAVLPDCERAALDQPHEQRVGQAAFDRGGANPRQGFELLLRAARADREDRRAALGRERPHNRGRIGSLAPFDTDVGDDEPQPGADRDQTAECVANSVLRQRLPAQSDEGVAAERDQKQGKAKPGAPKTAQEPPPRLTHPLLCCRPPAQPHFIPLSPAPVPRFSRLPHHRILRGRYGGSPIGA